MVNLKIKIRPFKVPKEVYLDIGISPRQEGIQTPKPIPLKELDVETLNELLRDFRAAVFKAAEKTDTSVN